jgi:hypothetical protein
MQCLLQRSNSTTLLTLQQSYYTARAQAHTHHRIPAPSHTRMHTPCCCCRRCCYCCDHEDCNHRGCCHAGRMPSRTLTVQPPPLTPPTGWQLAGSRQVQMTWYDPPCGSFVSVQYGERPSYRRVQARVSPPKSSGSTSSTSLHRSLSPSQLCPPAATSPAATQFRWRLYPAGVTVAK